MRFGRDLRTFNDGAQATNESKDEEKLKEAKKVPKEVKEVHAMVRNIASQDHDLLPGSSMSYPVLVQLIANNPRGVSTHLAHPYFSLGFQLSNKTNCSPIGVHLLGHFQSKPDRCPYRGQSRAPGSKLLFGGNSTTC